PQRIRADQVGFGGAQLLLARARGAHLLPFLADQRDRLADPAVLGGDGAKDQPGATVGHERGRNAIGQPALFADLLHQPAAKPAAADDVVVDIGGIPVGIVALRPGLAKADRALRHLGAADDKSTVVGWAGVGDPGAGIVAAARRQAAEHRIDEARQLGRGDVADSADDEALAVKPARGETGEIVAGDRADAGGSAVAVVAV